MKRLSIVAMGLLVVVFTVFGCASHPSSSAWTTFIDG